VIKLGVFVEGYTEVVFVERLIEEIAGKNNVLIEHREIRGGTNVRRTFARVRAIKPNTGQKYFVLIVDCGGDVLVKTRIREEHENLTRSGYVKIIGIRDVRPNFLRADIPRLERELPTYIRTSLIPVKFILAVMEIEAWFLAEATHFPKIDPAITVPAIRASLGFDPEVDDMEQRNTPADDLNDCYAIGGKQYVKGAAEDTVKALAFERVYLHLVDKFNYIYRLITSIEEFLV
jgi:hypothetical protein